MAIESLPPRSLHGLDTADLLKEARRQAGLTQAALAERLGTTQSAVSRWERGREEPRLSTLAGVLDACGVRAQLSFEIDDGVDRAQIRQRLAMTPAQRLAEVTNLSRLLTASRRA